MFPRSQRLTEKRRFAILFRRGQWVRGKLFSCVALPAKDSGQIAFILTKKVAKSAVVRNAMKRRLRAAFLAANHDPAAHAVLSRHLMAVVIHQDTRLIDFSLLETMVKQQLQKVALGGEAAARPKSAS